MYDQFDKQLAERIKEVFDTYEENSDEAWENFRKEYPGGRERRPLFYYWMSAAAALLLCAGVWAYLSMETSVPPPQHQVAVRSKKALPEIEMEPRHAGIRQREEEPSEGNQKVLVIPPKTEAGYQTSADTTVQDLLASRITLADEPAKAKEVAAEPQRPDKTVPSSVSPKNSPVGPPPLSPEEYNRMQGERLAQLQEKTAPAKADPAGKKDPKLLFSVVAGSYMNYAEGSKGSVNAGVGLSSEIGISKKLKILTGVALARNTLKYNQLIPTRAADVFLEAPSRSETLLANSLQARTSSLNYSINAYDASLLGLDFPINLKYVLLQNKRELYVVAGVSSNLFIDEAYTYNYEYSDYSSSSSYPNKKTTENANNFDLARMLNFSVGFGYPVGKNRLSFEPFVKYPLGGMGAQNIRFGSAGVNLKLNFSRGR